ncbi:SNF2-related protein [Chitinophaga japonensis]|uniref:Helicase ATP-binding domain-containing protein n=1 Tax=Chitinophaga japonensis TaxID=104662 RepID=A0A562SZR8_CHIJA|nr:SNF2-related protein [Chitinophaga japonensis]TWI86326.1 hypothetical protein LX66_3580 [Chitinophaga japonensis]
MLRDYQLKIAEQARGILNKYGLVYLSMEVRTGKSLTSMHAAYLMQVKNVLFVTKKKAISSVVSDYDKLAPSFMIDIINFESLHHIRKQYDLIIIDEAHTCGGFPTMPERTKQLKDICEGKPVIFLSGTPTPESYSQLYHQLSISSHSPWVEYKSFYSWVKGGYVMPQTKYMYNREFKDYSNADEARIKSETAHLFISFSQQDAGFEQLVQEEVIIVKMQPSTYWLANKIIKNKVYIGKNGEQVIADTAVKVQQKCHQIYSGTVICEDKTAICFDDTKARVIKERFAGQKIAIFYKFNAEGTMLKVAFASRWTEDPEEFNRRGDLTFISQIVSGREGVNLSTADALVMFNIDFSALSYWQSRARLQTKDRVKEAPVYWLFSEGGIEEKIYQVVQQKKDYTLSYFKKDFGYAGIKSSDKDNIMAEKERLVCSEDNPAK